MTDKEKLLNIIDHMGPIDKFEDIIMYFMNVYCKEFSLSRIYCFIDDLRREFLDGKIAAADACKNLAYERATYIKSYLEGKMFNTEEEARKHIDAQIGHAQTIIDISKKV